MADTSAVGIPASCSFDIAMICSSLNLLRFILSDSFASDSTQNRSHFRGARQRVLDNQRATARSAKDGPLEWLLSTTVDAEARNSGPDTINLDPGRRLVLT